jgi:hypothetical protein
MGAVLLLRNFTSDIVKLKKIPQATAQRILFVLNEK